MGKLTLQQLESHLWESANILRGSIDSSDYKNYIFGLLFLKRLSDVFIETAKEIEREENDDYGWYDRDEHQFFVPERARWTHIQVQTNDIGNSINIAFEALEEENPSLVGVLANIDFNDKDKLPDKLLLQLIQHFSSIDLSNGNLSEPDMLGRAYEYLIKKFADDAGKKGGEFYTPTKVVELIVNLIKPEEGMRICDPTVGSGGMLIQSVDYIKSQGADPRNLSLHGQERNLSTWAICKMNLLLHGLSDHRIEREDTIRQPKLLGDDKELLLYDRVIANPPFSLKNWGHEEVETDEYGRFLFGLPPTDRGDYAFVQHMYSALNARGKAGIVLPLGALSRGKPSGKTMRMGSEGIIRKGLIEDDAVEAVISLPDNIFYGDVAIPAAILILTKHKEAEKVGKVIFIDGSRNYKTGKGQNFIGEQDIDTIVKCFDDFEDKEGICSIVSNIRLRDEGYNLHVGRYVNPIVNVEPVELNNMYREVSKSEGTFVTEVQKFMDNLDKLNSKISVQNTSNKWPEKNLRDFFKEVSIKNKDDADLPVLSVTKNNGIMLASERFNKQVHSDDTSGYKVIKDGQFVYDPMLLWTGAIGVQNVVDVGLVSPAYYVLECLDDDMSIYFKSIMQTKLMVERYKSRSEGTNQRRRKVQIDDFLDIKIPIPPEEILTDLIKYLKLKEQTTTNLKKYLSDLNALSAGLMDNFVVGNITLKNESKK
nr:N-6 DNA methylase [Lentibacillus jeotgali]